MKLTSTGTINQTLQYTPGSQYVYSDLSMITMMYIVGKLARVNGLVSHSDLLPACIMSGPSGPWRDQCYYEAYVRNFVVGAVGLRSTMFLLPLSLWRVTAPTWNDTNGYAPGPGYRHRYSPFYSLHSSYLHIGFCF